MPIIAIDTALKHCSIAIVNGDETLFEAVEHAPSNQAEILPDLVAAAIKQCGIKNKDIIKIITTIGPGSFTGVRVGLAFVKGLGLSLGAELVGVSTLEGFMTAANAQNTICAINVAGSVFTAAKSGDEWVLAPQRFENYDILNEYQNFTLCGHAIPQDIKDKYGFSGDEFIPPLILAHLGAKYNSINHPPIPQYMRGADAKLWTKKF